MFGAAPPCVVIRESVSRGPTLPDPLVQDLQRHRGILSLRPVAPVAARHAKRESCVGVETVLAEVDGDKCCPIEGVAGHRLDRLSPDTQRFRTVSRMQHQHQDEDRSCRFHADRSCITWQVSVDNLWARPKLSNCWHHCPHQGADLDLGLFMGKSGTLAREDSSIERGFHARHEIARHKTSTDHVHGLGHEVHWSSGLRGIGDTRRFAR